MKTRTACNILALVTLICAAGTARAQLDPNTFTSLGTLNIATGDNVVIDTTAGTITINGNPAINGVTQTQTGAASISVFTFSHINIAAGANITLEGNQPLALLSQGNAVVNSAFDASGGAGSATLGSTTPGAAVLGGGNGGAGNANPGSDASPGQSTINGNGGHAFHNPIPTADPTVISYDGGGGGNGGAGGAGGSGAGAASGVNPKSTLVGGGGGAGGPYLIQTTAGPQPGAGGGAGGGGVEIIASGTLSVSNVVSNGGHGGGPNPVNSGNQYGGGGAGGSIVLGGQTLLVSGAINANGGDSVPGTGAGAGGGGAVALIGTPSFVLGSTAAAGLGVTVNVNGGSTGGGGFDGNAGAIDAKTVGVTATAGHTALWNGTAFTNAAPSQTQTATQPGITISFGHDVVLDGGILQFTGGTTFGGNVAVTNNNGTIDTQGFNETITSGVTGNGALTKIGTGTLTLSSNADQIVGGINLQNGKIVVAGANALGLGDLNQSAGTTLSTGGGDHTIGIGGNYNMNGGTLVINLNAVSGAITNDEVVTSGGSATLNGNLTINYAGPHLAAGTSETYTIVDTNGGGIVSAGVGFTNPVIHSGAIILTAVGATTGTDFDVTLTSTQSTFATLGGFTPNQHATATYIDTVIASGATNPGLTRVINALDDVSPDSTALDSALNELMPINFANFTSSTAFNSSDFLVEQMDNYIAGHRGTDGQFIASANHLDTTGFNVAGAGTAQGLQGISSRLLAWNPAPSTGLMSDTPAPVLGGVDLRSDTKSMRAPTTEPQPWNVFVAGDAILAQNFSDNSVGTAHDESTTGQVRIGADYTVTPNLLVGFLADFAHTDVTLDNENSRATVDSYQPGVYASYSNNGWYGNAISSYSWNEYTQHRNVVIAGFNGRADSAPTGDQILGNLDGGYDFHQGPWTFGPTIGLKYVHMDVNGYTENGLPGADLVVNRDEADSLRSRLGGRISYVLQDGDMQFVPHFDASWVHEFMDNSRGINSQFTDVPAGTFSVSTASPSRESALVTLGLDAKVDSTFTVFTNYTVQAGQDNYFGQSVQAGVKIGF